MSVREQQTRLTRFMVSPTGSAASRLVVFKVEPKSCFQRFLP